MQGSPRDTRLSEAELCRLQEIEREVRRTDPDFPERVGSRPGQWHPPVRQTGAALRWPVVAAVMLGAIGYAAVLLALPTAATIVAIIAVQLALVPAGCLIWACRRGEL